MLLLCIYNSDDDNNDSTMTRISRFASHLAGSACGLKNAPGDKELYQRLGDFLDRAQLLDVH